MSRVRKKKILFKGSVKRIDCAAKKRTGEGGYSTTLQRERFIAERGGEGGRLWKKCAGGQKKSEDQGKKGKKKKHCLGTKSKKNAFTGAIPNAARKRGGAKRGSEPQEGGKETSEKTGGDSRRLGREIFFPQIREWKKIFVRRGIPQKEITKTMGENNPATVHKPFEDLHKGKAVI